MTSGNSPRCVCCDRPLDDPSVAIFNWCGWCVGAVLHELLAIGDLKPSEAAIMADMFRQVGAPTMASVVTRVPFEVSL